MKSLANYLKLWQNKRNELQVNVNPEADWAQMHRLLDQHLPVVSPPPAGNAFFKSAGFKLLAAAIITPGLAALVYLAVQHNQSDKREKLKRPDSTITVLSATDQRRLHTAHIEKITSQADTFSAIQGEARRDTAPAVVTLSGSTSASASANGQQDKAASPENKSDNPAATRTIDVNSSTTGKPTADRISANNKVTGGNKANNKSALINNRYNRPNEVSISNLNNSNSNGGGEANPGVNTPDKDSRSLVGSAGVSGRQGLIAQSSSWSIQSTLTHWQNTLYPGSLNSVVFIPKPVSSKALKGKKPKVKREKAAKDSTKTGKGPDWGVMLAVTPASITDLSPGAFLSFDVESKWAVGAQVRLLSPQKLNGSYTHRNESKKDTTAKTLTVTDSRKLFNAQVPVYVAYKATENLRLKVGGLLTLPMKQGSGKSVVNPVLSKDTAYVNKNTILLNNTKYQSGVSLGITAGAELRLRRFIFEATYLQPLRKQQVTSDLGSYTAGGGQLQLSVGFKFNRLKE